MVSNSKATLKKTIIDILREREKDKKRQAGLQRQAFSGIYTTSTGNAGTGGGGVSGGGIVNITKNDVVPVADPKVSGEPPTIDQKIALVTAVNNLTNPGNTGSVTHDFQGTGANDTGWYGRVWAEKFINLPAGAKIIDMLLKSSTFDQGANMEYRAIMYADDGGVDDPGTLLASSTKKLITNPFGEFSIGGNLGQQCAGDVYSDGINWIIPASGQAWIAFVTNQINGQYLFKTTGLPLGTCVTAVHTDGTTCILPNSPFGTPTDQTIAPWMKITIQL